MLLFFFVKLKDHPWRCLGKIACFLVMVKYFCLKVWGLPPYECSLLWHTPANNRWLCFMHHLLTQQQDEEIL